jgi:hypothetical protein
MARSKIGVGHDGRSNAFAKPGERTLATHHNPMDARQGDKPGEPAHRLGHRGHPIGGVVKGETVRAPGALDIQPRQGAPKALHPVPYHVSTTVRQIAGSGRGGMGHPSASVSDGGEKITTSAAAAPLEHAYGGALPKSRPNVFITPGMRDRRNDAVHGGSPYSGLPLNQQTAAHDAHANGRHDANKQIGRAIFDEALANSGPDDRAAHGHRTVTPTIRVQK